MQVRVYMLSKAEDRYLSLTLLTQSAKFKRVVLNTIGVQSPPSYYSKMSDKFCIRK